MQFKKTKVIIIIFITLWIIFIVWGIAKTRLKLSLEKTLPKKAAPQKTEISKPPSVEKKSEEIETVPILVRAFKVTRTSFSDILPVMGTVKGETEIELKFEINGVIKSIHFSEGAKINKDDPIASLNPKDAQLKLEYANSKLASSQSGYQSKLKNLEVNQSLYEAGAIIKSKLEEIKFACESAKFEVETAKAEKALADNELKKTTIYAPTDGVMGLRDAEEGEFVTPQDNVVSLFKIDDVLLEMGIVERDINKVKLGQNTKVYVDTYPDIVFEGTVDSISPVVEGRSRTLTAKIKVSNPENLLFPGMFCRAEILIFELKDALLAPSASLISAGVGITLAPVIRHQSVEIDGDGKKTGIVQLLRLKIGYASSDYVHIAEGLNEGDLVVIEAQGELNDNAKVQITAIEEMSF